MIFEKLFSKENKKDEIVDVKLSDKKFNELRIKLSSFKSCDSYKGYFG